jgi:ATP-dependent 26S proteasome regulatory subunit
MEMSWSAAVRPGRVGMPTGYAPLTRYDEAGSSAEEDRLRLSDVAKLGRRFRRGLVRTARFDDQPSFPKLLAAHLQTDLDQVEVVEESWPAHDLVNVQVGLVAFLAADGLSHELVGMRGHRRVEFGLADLLRPSENMRFGPQPGNVAWSQLATGPDGQVTPAALAAVYLVTAESLPGFQEGPIHLALMLRAADPEYDISAVQLHLVADRPGAAAAAAAEIRRLAVEHNVYRGQVITFNHDMFGERASALQFRRRPTVSAEDVILPAETLESIRRQTVGVARHRKALLAAGQHLKRGLLLYGPPGVGKTHSLRYLIAQMTDVTVLELSGDSLRGIATACSVARSLQPAMIVVEDVDLIAEDREMYDGPSPLLFQLLNEMDGLAEDIDVVFVLTTNRADMLEPALAARPGRVDQAVELRLPDADARRRLFELYRGGLQVDESNLDAVIERTEGVTASFLKELLRRAALIAADSGSAEGERLSVSAGHLDEALEELMDTRNAMTRTLLGGRRPALPALSDSRSPWDEDDAE